MHRRPIIASGLISLLAAGLLLVPQALGASRTEATVQAIPKADCGPGARPETGLQGQVSREDRDSGRSKQGYQCNAELIGQYQGQGSTWVSQSYGTCAYQPQAFPGSLTGPKPGLQVLDVRDPQKPTLVKTITSPVMVGGTWETLKVNTARGLMAGVRAGTVAGPSGFFEVYDIKTDCRNPRLLNAVVPGTEITALLGELGHEGNWSPDGKTYWVSGLVAGALSAIDVSDPTRPKVIWSGSTGFANHGFSLSRDGRRMYMSEADLGGAVTGLVPGTSGLSTNRNGLIVLDVSAVQDRRAAPSLTQLGRVFWTDGQTGQHSIPINYAGHPYVVFVDELGQGSARIIDIKDERNPRIASRLKLEIHLPQHEAERRRDTAGNGFIFGYDAHYCEVDRQDNPRRLACGFFNSGVRVFDITDPLTPREVAYYNPPAQTAEGARLTGSEHAQGITNGGPTGQALSDLSADWCSSPPRFVGRDQLWVSCQDNGFMVLKLSSSAAPSGSTTAGRAAQSPTTSGPPITTGQPAAAAPSGPGPASGTLAATGPVLAGGVAGLTALAGLCLAYSLRRPSIPGS